MRKITKQPKATTTLAKLNFPVWKYKYAVNPSNKPIKTSKTILTNLRVWFAILSSPFTLRGKPPNAAQHAPARTLTGA
jgi:hypothetical protein